MIYSLNGYGIILAEMGEEHSRNYKWILLALLSATYFLAQGARQIFNAVLPQIKADFAGAGITDTQLGLVGSAFTLVFGLAIPFGGLLADFFSRKWMIVVGTLLFAVGIFSSGLATGVVLLVVAYGVVNAAGQALLPPSNSSLIGQFHVETRATAFSVYQIVFYIGIVVCSCVSGWLSGLGEGGWRRAFFLFGALAAAWAFALAFLLRDTPQVRKQGIGKREERIGNREEDKASVREALGAFLGKPSALLLMAGLGFYFYAKYGFNTWIINYLQREFPSMTAASASFHGVFWFYLGAIAGVFAGGRVSDCIAVAGYPLDIHHSTGGDCTMVFAKDNYDIPYRCLVPKGVENLLVAGRCSGYTHEAMASTRVMSTCMAVGEAAGRAARLALKQGVPPSKVDVDVLRAELKDTGAYLG